jgi:hypothetical protein
MIRTLVYPFLFRSVRRAVPIWPICWYDMLVEGYLKYVGQYGRCPTDREFTNVGSLFCGSF